MQWLSALIAPIANLATAVIDRRKAADTAKAKLKLAKESNDQALQLTDAEWEALSKRTEGDGWKDEWVTVILTAPIAVVFVCALLAVALGDPTYSSAATAGVEAIKVLLPNYQDILEVVVFAAVSLKGIKLVTR